MSHRHRARETALQILYRIDLSSASHSLATTASQILAAQDLNSHFEHFNVNAELRPFAAELVTGALSKQAAIDELLEKQSANWKVNRMALVDRSLLRMALFELLFGPGTPPAVVIDEAIELAKQYGNAESPAFINGILDAIRKSSASA